MNVSTRWTSLPLSFDPMRAEVRGSGLALRLDGSTHKGVLNVGDMGDGPGGEEQSNVEWSSSLPWPVTTALASTLDEIHIELSELCKVLLAAYYLSVSRPFYRDLLPISPILSVKPMLATCNNVWHEIDSTSCYTVFPRIHLVNDGASYTTSPKVGDLQVQGGLAFFERVDGGARLVGQCHESLKKCTVFSTSALCSRSARPGANASALSLESSPTRFQRLSDGLFLYTAFVLITLPSHLVSASQPVRLPRRHPYPCGCRLNSFVLYVLVLS
nr:hypothetical protein CFP56_56543 [Quercus suber]